MRADPHYVEQLTARTPLPQLRALPIRDIDALAPPPLGEIDALIASITRFGIVQPLLVRSRGTRFELIGGFRRLAAAAKAGLTDVPCLVYTCDESRARALAEADNVRGVMEPEASAADESLDDAPPSALDELRRSFGTIESCLHLVNDREASLRDRVALELIRTETHRANRLVQCLSIVSTDPALAFSPLSLRSVVDQALEVFGPERRLSGVDLQTDVAEGPHVVSGDSEWLAIGVAGAIGGMLALVQTARTPAMTLRISAAPSRTSVLVELMQRAVPVSARDLQRFFDAGWIDRPGGYQAAVELAAARRIADLHRGTAEVTSYERGGCRLTLVIPSLG
jgi:signal transduction histidine kinase